MAHGKPTFYFSIFNKQSACEFTSAAETEASISFETFVKHGLGLVWQSANNTRNNHSSSSLSINNPKCQIIASVLFLCVGFLCVLFFTLFPTMGTTWQMHYKGQIWVRYKSVLIGQKRNCGRLVKVSTVSTPNVFQIPCFSSMLSFTKRF